jgi:hypothetical protein
MEDKYKKLLGSINLIEPPKNLASRVLARIENEEKRLTKIRAWAFGGSSVVSFSLSLWAVVYLIKSAVATGFGQYLTLIFSENGIALAYSRELSLSLAESLPLTSLILFLAAIGFFIWSLTKATSPLIAKFSY